MEDKGKVVDLPRVRDALERLEEHLEAHPELRSERTTAFLAGELEGAEAPQGGSVSERTAIKIPTTMFDRATALTELMNDAPELAAASHKSASAVIRVALAIGLKSLERKYPATDGE